MAIDRHRQPVLTWHLVKFCPPSECTGNRAVAVAEYRLACGHLLRLKHFGLLARRVAHGHNITPLGGWPCFACARCSCPL
jgi:hypothetical protein